MSCANFSKDPLNFDQVYYKRIVAIETNSVLIVKKKTICYCYSIKWSINVYMIV